MGEYDCAFGMCSRRQLDRPKGESQELTCPWYYYAKHREIQHPCRRFGGSVRRAGVLIAAPCTPASLSLFRFRKNRKERP